MRVCAQSRMNVHRRRFYLLFSEVLHYTASVFGPPLLVVRATTAMGGDVISTHVTAQTCCVSLVASAKRLASRDESVPRDGVPRQRGPEKDSLRDRTHHRRIGRCPVSFLARTPRRPRLPEYLTPGARRSDVTLRCFVQPAFIHEQLGPATSLSLSPFSLHLPLSPHPHARTQAPPD